MSTQSGDDTKPPTALAKLHLEDGSTLVGRSFGCHESVSGEVRGFE
jgi:carbamoylphosphate synthase small subunit